MPQLFVGTSGFAYASWKPGFYPAKLPAKQFLQHYAGRLNSTEVNYTFRQLPKADTLKAWVEATPAEFVFSLKAHMRLTHILKLKDAAFVPGGVLSRDRSAEVGETAGAGALSVAADSQVRPSDLDGLPCAASHGLAARIRVPPRFLAAR